MRTIQPNIPKDHPSVVLLDKYKCNFNTILQLLDLITFLKNYVMPKVLSFPYNVRKSDSY
jgi:hypothetical protein